MGAEAIKLCRRCGSNPVHHRNAYCGECNAALYQHVLDAARKRNADRKQRLADEDTIIELGRAAHAAGLTVADIDAMSPPLNPEDERLMSHG